MRLSRGVAGDDGDNDDDLKGRGEERLLGEIGSQVRQTTAAGLAAILLMACTLAIVLAGLGMPPSPQHPAAVALQQPVRAESYTAAFAELRAQAVPGSGPATLALNVRRSAEAAEAAARAGADILVLPEYGLSGFGSGRDAWIPYLEQLLPPGGVPCDSPEQYLLAPSLVGLSCAAREYGIVLVANIGDLIYCDAGPSPPPPGCESSRDGRLQYNTAVAFDTDGTYLTRAHKQNLWGESGYFDEPVDCDLATSSFTTSFGVRFGLFTCADLIYEYPAEALLLKQPDSNEQPISNFVAPMAWSDEMAQMQALPTFQGWSYTHCVNLVATNHRGPDMSGSGAFSCGRVVQATFDPGTGDAPLHFATLPARPVPGPVARPGLSEIERLNLQAVRTAHSSSARASLGDSVSGSIRANAWTFARLDADPGEGWQSLCSNSGNVCCTVLSLIGAGPEVARGYVLAVLDGDDRGGGTHWSGAACAVLACSNPGPDCLTYQRAPAAFDAQLAGIIMAMTTEPAIGPNITIFPMALAEPTEGAAAQGNNQTGAATAGQFNSPELQRLLEPFRPTAELEYSVLTGAPGYGFWRLQAAALPIGSSGPLVSALLYGRVFRLDDLSYDCPVPE